MLVLLASAGTLSAQSAGEGPYYARKNSFGVFVGYSNDSSHMVLGAAEQRKLLSFGVTYKRRLLLNRVVNWMYDGELMPVALESDPLSRVVTKETSPNPVTIVRDRQAPPIVCSPQTTPYSYTFPDGPTYSGVVTVSCRGRQWTMGEGMSPVGFSWNFLPRRAVQPFLVGHGGYMYSTHPIPVEFAGAFNFTFDFGVGLEFYRTRSQSVRVEYRYHHISDDWTSDDNPGIDSGLMQLTYSFGR